ncbi:MAG: hypothetical protein ACM3KR_02140 [Deltaproteobacteria bacterium]
MDNKIFKDGGHSIESREVIYEVKLVLDALSEEERNMYPKELLDFIEKRALPKPGFTIDFKKELKGQISEKALLILGYIVRHYVKK